MSRILVVEDSTMLALGLRDNLEYDGHLVDVVGGAEAALSKLDEPTPYDLLVLDLMLPGMDGFRLIDLLRGAGRDLPILVLTARGDEDDKVRALRSGADDYVTKPFGLHELLARVGALLRRAGERSRMPVPGPRQYRCDEFEVDVGRREVHRLGELVAFRPKELDLFLALLARRGNVVTRRQLMDEVWGYHESTVSRTLDTHIVELRRRLQDDPLHPHYVITVRKVGYRIGPPVVAS